MDIILLFSAIVPAVILMWVFVRSDEFPEPTGVLLTTFFLGALLIPVFFLIHPILQMVESFIPKSDPYVFGVGQAFFIAAIPEEFFKFLVLWGFAVHHRAFDEPMDGIVYGVAAALGFATVENLFYVMDGGLDVAFARAVTAVPAHAMFGAIMGYYTGRAVFASHTKKRLYFMALLTPIVLHGLYDVPPLIFKAADDMEANIPGFIFLGLCLLFIYVVQLQINITARAIGILKKKQRRGMVPRFVFERVRSRFYGIASANEASFSQPERGECSGQIPLCRLFSIVFYCAAGFVMMVLALEVITGTVGAMDVLFYCSLAGVMVYRASQYRREHAKNTFAKARETQIKAAEAARPE